MTTTLSGRQQEIIEAVGKILTTSGIGGLTIKNLAREMNFSESAIYRHFSGKSEILLTLLDYLAENMRQRFDSLDQQGPADERLISMFESQTHFFAEHPYFTVAVFSDGLLEESEEINKAILKIMNVKKNHLGTIIADGRATGVFTDSLTDDWMIHILMSSFRLLMFKWRASYFSFDINRESGRLTESLLTLIKKS